jgi:hypothetical protein
MARKTVLSIVSLVALSLAAATAFANNNDDKTIREVEVTESQVLFHLTTSQNGTRPSCTIYNSIVGCSLSEPSCEHMLSAGLAAQLSGRTVDIDVANSCSSGTVNVAKVIRLRVN